jgi:hypothetical protein
LEIFAIYGFLSGSDHSVLAAEEDQQSNPAEEAANGSNGEASHQGCAALGLLEGVDCHRVAEGERL